MNELGDEVSSVYASRPVPSSSASFFFSLRVPNQRVDCSGAYNWECSLLYWAGKKKNQEAGVGGGGEIL